MSAVNVCSLCVCLLYICICECFVNGVCIHGLAVVEACGGLQGFTGISACAKYQLGTRCGAVFRTCLFVASHCCDSDQG